MLASILMYYARAKWDQNKIKTQKQLLQCQAHRWQQLKKNVLCKSPFYQAYLDKPLSEFPIINKEIMMTHFDSINTQGLKKSQVLDMALQAEESRDFSPMINSA